jgi:hypothetical protein
VATRPVLHPGSAVKASRTPPTSASCRTMALTHPTVAALAALL